MSLVTTAISKRSRSCLQSESTRAVFPEPTGPPTPTRRTAAGVSRDMRDPFYVRMRMQLMGAEIVARSEQLRPLAAGLRGTDDGIDETHALDPVRQRWNPGIDVLAAARRTNGDGVGDIQICKGFQEALRVTRGQTRQALSLTRDVRAAAAQDLNRMMQRREAQLIGLSLTPGEAAALTIHAQPQPIVFPNGHLAHPQRPARAAVKAQLHARVVIEHPTGNETRQLGGQRLEAQPRNEAHQLKRVRADVADAAANAGATRIGAPGSLRRARMLECGREPALRILDLYHAQRAE